MLALPPTSGRPSRRVSDQVLRAFEYACVMRDVRTATMLLAVQEDLHTRRVSRFGGDRRKATGELDAARALLDRARAAVGDQGGGTLEKQNDPAMAEPADAGRRVSDQVLRTFEYACAMRDVRTARMLLAVLEDVQTGRASHVDGDRRQPDGTLDAASALLERTCAELVDQGGMTTDRRDHATLAVCLGT